MKGRYQRRSPGAHPSTGAGVSENGDPIGCRRTGSVPFRAESSSLDGADVRSPPEERRNSHFRNRSSNAFERRRFALCLWNRRDNGYQWERRRSGGGDRVSRAGEVRADAGRRTGSGVGWSRATRRIAVGAALMMWMEDPDWRWADGTGSPPGFFPPIWWSRNMRRSRRPARLWVGADRSAVVHVPRSLAWPRRLSKGKDAVNNRDRLWTERPGGARPGGDRGRGRLRLAALSVRGKPVAFL